MTEPTYNKHILSLTAIFILGDAIILLPRSSSEYSVFGLVISAVTSVLLFLIIFPISKILLSNQDKVYIKPFSIVFLILTAIFGLYSAGAAFTGYIDFVNKILLPDTPKFFIATVFIASVAYLSAKGEAVILKLSLIFIFVAAVSVVAFFLLTAKDFSLRNLSFNGMPGFTELYEVTKPYFGFLSLPALLIPQFGMLFTNKYKFSASFFGLVTGLCLVTLCALCPLLLFGAPLSSALPFPLSAAVSTVTVGPLFTRMDGIIYCLFFISALIKTSASLKLCLLALKKLNFS